jgi:hypothetical protein
MNQSETLVKDIINKLYPDFKAIHSELEEYQVRGSLTVENQGTNLEYQEVIKFIGYDYKSQQWIKIED